jgi:small subunit ribosomal protein S9
MAAKLPGGVCSICRSRLRFTTRRRVSFPHARPFGHAAATSSIAAPPIDFGALPPPNPANARLVPASPSYFTGSPKFTDGFLSLQALLRRHQALPTVEPSAAPRVAWHTLAQYRSRIRERVPAAKYGKIRQILQRLNRIHPALMPQDVVRAMAFYKRDIDPYANVAKPGVVDEFGRAYGLGRRKSSTARAWLVEGEGEVLVNGKTLNEAFGRIHDRESAIWALKATNRVDKYNAWILVRGGGTTGQAESITLALAKALMVHEPDLKPALRRGESGAEGRITPCSLGDC